MAMGLQPPDFKMGIGLIVLLTPAIQFKRGGKISMI